MMVTNEGKRRIGDQQLGVLFDGGKVRCRREWRGVKDTLYDYCLLYTSDAADD